MEYYGELAIEEIDRKWDLGINPTVYFYFKYFK